MNRINAQPAPPSSSQALAEAQKPARANQNRCNQNHKRNHILIGTHIYNHNHNHNYPLEHHHLLALTCLLIVHLACVGAGPSSFLSKGSEVPCTRGQPVDLMSHIPGHYSPSSSGKMRASNCIQDAQGGWISCDCPDGHIRCEYSKDCARREPSMPAMGPVKHQAGGRTNRFKAAVQPHTKSATVSNLAGTTRKGPINHHLSGSSEHRSEFADHAAFAETLGISVEKLTEKIRRKQQIISDRTTTTTTTTSTTTTSTTTTTPLPDLYTTELTEDPYTEPFMEPSMKQVETLEETLEDVHGNEPYPEDYEQTPSTQAPDISETTTPISQTTTTIESLVPINIIQNNSIASQTTATTKQRIDLEIEAEQISNDGIFYLAIGAELLVIVIIFSLAAFFRYRDLKIQTQMQVSEHFARCNSLAVLRLQPQSYLTC